MKRTVVRGIVFAMLPLSALELLIAARALAPAPDLWFSQVVTAACSRKVDFVFAGSSRVAAAIDSDAFSRKVAEAARTPVTAVNMGRGYTTLLEHHLALQRLYDTCRGQMSGATVLLEAPDGLPDFSTFRDPWVHSDEPGLIVPLMGPREVVRFWTESRTPVTDKVVVTARLVRSVNYLEATRRRLLTLDQRLRRHLASRRRPASTGAAPVDLTSAGGVITDPRAVERARRLAVSLAPSTFRDSRRVENWSATVLMGINRLVRERGGRVVVFHMPLSSVQQIPYRTRTRRADAESFRREAAMVGIRYLEPSFDAGDEDFPDYWHLRASRAREFSQRIAEQYVSSAARAFNQRASSRMTP